MVEIKVIFYGSPIMLHWYTHVNAVITDLATQQEVEIEYANDPGWVREQRLVRGRLSSARSSDCCCNIVTLYSNKSLVNFVFDYNEKYSNTENNYSPCFNNCAHAVDFTLDYFFSDAGFENCLYTTLRLLCSAGCIGTFGLLSCFPTPPLTASPSDTYRKAKLLSLRFGSMEEVAETQVVEVANVRRYS